MGRSPAYQDFSVRFREAVTLLKVSFDASGGAGSNPMLASAAAKGAVVLVAAALERFMNDALRQACQRLKVSDYEHLSDGQKSYLCAQIARRIGAFATADGDYRGFNQVRRESLALAIRECASALNDPSLWQHMPDFGLFLDGAAAPERIAAVLRDFEPRLVDVYVDLDSRAGGRGVILRALSQLIDARHDAAHAKSQSSPSPSDARTWIANTFWVMRLVEGSLVRASPL